MLIECGSASSFELSPRFANLSIRGSQEHIQDVENELREAMTDMAIDNNRTSQREGRRKDYLVEFIFHTQWLEGGSPIMATLHGFITLSSL